MADDTSSDADSDRGEILTRDLGGLQTDGPQLTQFESPTARANATDPGQRPAFSGVGQPGMNEEIWYRTVDDRRQAQAGSRRESRGMIGRLHEPRRRVVVQERRRRRGGQ